MKIILGDGLVVVEGWSSKYTFLGGYTLKGRKTPEEIAAEKEVNLKMGIKGRVDPVKKSKENAIEVVDDKAYFLAGLWPRVEAYLKKVGENYTVVDKRNPEIRPEPDYSKVADLNFRYRQDETLALVAISDYGIIKCSTGFGKSFLISAICKIYPTLNILICTNSAQVVGMLYENLHKELPGEVGYIYQKGNTSAGKRIVVSTAKSVSRIDPTRVQLMLVDECHGFSANQAGRDVANFAFCRRFGFSASPERPDGSAIVMESLFGPVIQDISYEEACNNDMVTPIKYAMLECNNCAGFIKGNVVLDDALMKKFCYWRNNSRNRLIADAVNRIHAVTDGQILIMVDTLEHAIRLNQYLPWFKVAHYGAMDEENLRGRLKDLPVDIGKYKMKPKQLDIMRHAFAKGTLRYVIATTTWRQLAPLYCEVH